jgi:hypothetical protein
MNSHYDEPLKAIDGRARTVRELLDKAKYAIDFYQREYAWQVRELIDVLAGKTVGGARHVQISTRHFGVNLACAVIRLFPQTLDTLT